MSSNTFEELCGKHPSQITTTREKRILLKSCTGSKYPPGRTTSPELVTFRGTVLHVDHSDTMKKIEEALKEPVFP